MVDPNKRVRVGLRRSKGTQVAYIGVTVVIVGPWVKGYDVNGVRIFEVPVDNVAFIEYEIPVADPS